jgi:SRSO17 transposase
MRWRIERDYQELKQEFGLGITKGGAGKGFTITQHFASPPTAF